MSEKKPKKQKTIYIEPPEDQTIVDMNVEGFRWYSPNKKSGKQAEKVSKKEQRKMILGAYLAYLPVLITVVVVAVVMFLIAAIWLS